MCPALLRKPETQVFDMDVQESETAARPPEGDDEAVETVQVVEFRLGDDDCAIDIANVDGIVETKTVTRVPRTPEAIDGVMDLRGETTAILDPKTFLGIEEATDDADDQNVLVLDRPDDKQKVGIRVDEVLEVGTYPRTRIDAGEDLDDLDTLGIDEQVARGIIRKPGEGGLDLLIWIDVDGIIEGLNDSSH